MKRAIGVFLMLCFAVIEVSIAQESNKVTKAKSNDAEIINLISVFSNQINRGKFNQAQRSTINLDKNLLKKFPLVNKTYEENIYNFKNSLSVFKNNPDSERVFINLDLDTIQKINNNEYLLDVTSQLYNSRNYISEKLSLPVIYLNGEWRIVLKDKLNYIIHFCKTNTTTNISTNIDERINNTALIPFPHATSPVFFYDLNRTLTQQNLDLNFFSTSNTPDMELIRYGDYDPDPDILDQEDNKKAAFASDLRWSRIVYGQKDQIEMKALRNENLQLDNWMMTGLTTAMNTNTQNYLYAVGILPKDKVFKFLYNHNTNTLSLNKTITVPNAFWLNDISYYNNQKFFITDIGNDRILLMNDDGEILKEITEFCYNNQTYQIDGISRLECGQLHPIAFIDKHGHRAVIGDIELSSCSFTAYNVVEFPDPSLLSDVGMSYDAEVFFTDLAAHKAHKFNYFGEYICSFSNSDWFHFPSRVSRIAYNRPEMPFVPIYFANPWGDGIGIRRFLLGSDVIDMSYEQSGYVTSHFNYRVTGDSYIKVQILQNGNVIRTIREENWWRSGYYTESIAWRDFTPGDYQLKIYFKHWQDDFYNDWGQGLRSRTLNFTITQPAVPVISGFVQKPEPICIGSSGKIYVNLVNESTTDYGTCFYEWTATDLPAGATLSYNESQNFCTITYPYSKLTSREDYINPPSTVRCRVSNESGSARKDFYPSFSTDCGGGIECPTLSFTENESMFTDNTLLIGSPDNPEVDIEDYYMINERIKPQHKEVSLKIHEPETAHTWLDNADLLQVKAKPNENIAVTPDGEIISYKLPNKPFPIILNDTVDVTAILADRDDDSYTFENGDVLKVILGNKYKAGTASYVVVDAYKPPPKEQEFAEIKTKYNKQAPGFNGIEDKDFGLFNLRPYKSTVCKKLDSALGDTLLVEILQYGTMDLFTIAADEQTARVNELGLVSAVHSTYGDVKNALTSTAETYAEILPGEGIDIKFATPNNGIGNYRYILHVTGRYTEDDSMFIAKQTAGENRGLIPEKTELVGAYPNPFNPSTTIEYTLKEDRPVTLKVYDILGSEVATLVNREEPAGRYSVIFNTAAINGGLPSGVYIYRFQAGEYSDVKKLLLVK